MKSSAGMDGRICIITGSNSGIGKAAALGLARMGATIIMVCRSKDRGDAARKEIISKSGNQSIDLMVADLSAQEAIHQVARDFRAKYTNLHVLVNNAGVFLLRRSMTTDGIETTLAVNHLAPFLLTNLLLDTLKANAPARVVNVSSSAHYGASIEFDNLQGERHFSGFAAYSSSKLANVLFTYELARRLDGSGVTANCLHPGVIRTSLGRDNGWAYRAFSTIVKAFFRSPQKGAETVIYLASSPDAANVTGKYFTNKAEKRSSPESYDRSAGERLWQVSAELTRLA